MAMRTNIALTVIFILVAAMAHAQHQHDTAQPPVKTAPAKTSAPPLQPAEGASIKILAPTKGEVLKGDKVEINYQLTKGKRGHHAHA